MRQLNDIPSVRIGNLLVAWLKREDWDTNNLLRWLQYIDLPPVGQEDEPYVWLLRGLKNERRGRWRELASRLARALNDEPDVTRPGQRPDQVLYNLLMLAAGLKCAEELAEPLYKMLGRREIDGRWRGVELRSCLRMALIENQIDNRLQPVWKAMLYNQGDDFLRGNKYDGFEGIISIPGEPNLDVLGNALKAMAEHLKKRQDIRPELRRLINRVIEKYPENRNWDVDLIKQAHKHRWPTIAVECLPTLYIPLKRKSTGLYRFILWRYVFYVVRDKYHHEIEATLCGGEIFKVQLPKEAAQVVEYTAPRLEEARLNNPFPTEVSMIKVIVNKMSEIESDFLEDGRPDFAQTVANLRQAALDSII